MKKPFMRRCAALASALAAATGTLLTGATPAHAAVANDHLVVAAGGSDTTEKAMNTIMADLNGTVLGGFGTGDGGTATRTLQTYNIPAFTSGFGPVPGDVGCSADNQTWNKDPLAPAGNTAATVGIEPFGSGAGTKYLTAEEGAAPVGGANAGCVDVARSSGAPAAAGGAQSHEQFYAYALDAVSWATTSLHAPGALTVTDIDKIYDCVWTNWNQVPGGTTGAIQRYIPQPGSGTRKFFITDVLRKPSSYTPPTGVAGCPDSKEIEENEGQAITAADKDKAILPYSAAVWSLHVNNAANPSLNRSNGARLGGMINDAIAPPNTPNDSAILWNSTARAYKLNTTTAVVETNVAQATGVAAPPFPGVRYVYNVVDSAIPASSYYAASKLFGFTNAGGADLSGNPVCNGSEASAILDNGFATLSSSDGPGANGSNIAGSRCRFFQGIA